jgi:hypothetical protein
VSNVVPFFRCKLCGARGSRLDLQLRGTSVGTIVGCDVCLAKTEATLARVRPIFDAAIAAGVPRDLANEALTFILDDPRFERGAS